MARKESIIKRCQSVIEKLLQEYAKYPYLNMREEDFRSSLLQKLRTGVKEKVGVKLEWDRRGKAKQSLKHDGGKQVTSRVHAEVQLGKKNDKQKVDIVVLKNQPVSFCVRQSETDVLAKIDIEDVEVVIEVKAAPSNVQHPQFQKDIKKLKKLRGSKSNLWRLLVVVDKSLPLGMSHDGMKAPNWSWQKSLKKTRASRGDVEVWFLDEDWEVKHMVKQC